MTGDNRKWEVFPIQDIVNQSRTHRLGILWFSSRWCFGNESAQMQKCLRAGTSQVWEELGKNLNTATLHLWYFINQKYILRFFLFVPHGAPFCVFASSAPASTPTKTSKRSAAERWRTLSHASSPAATRRHCWPAWGRERWPLASC